GGVPTVIVASELCADFSDEGSANGCPIRRLWHGLDDVFGDLGVELGRSLLVPPPIWDEEPRIPFAITGNTAPPGERWSFPTAVGIHLDEEHLGARQLRATILAEVPESTSRFEEFPERFAGSHRAFGLPTPVPVAVRIEGGFPPGRER